MNTKLKMMLCLGVATVILLLPGCSTTKRVSLDPKNPVSITLWNYYNGAQKTAFDTMVEEFNETTGHEEGIIVNSISKGSINQLTDEVMASANEEVGASNLPNIFSAYADTAVEIDQMGLLTSLNQYLSKKEIQSYNPSYIKEGTLGGSSDLKIFPIAKSTEILMINKTDFDRFSQATGATTDDLATIEGVTKTAEAYYNWSGGKAFFNRDALANYMLVGSKELGADIFTVDDKGAVTLNLDKAIMRKLWDNYYVPYIKGYFTAVGKFSSDDTKTGDILAFVGSTTASNYFPTKVILNDTESYPIEAMVLDAPQFEGGKDVAVQQGAGMVVTKTNESEEYAATVFLKWLTDTDRNTDFAISAGYLPVKTEASTSDNITAALNRAPSGTISDRTAKSLNAAVHTAESHELYTLPVFDAANKARKTLDSSMGDLAKADRADIEASIAAGTPVATATAKYLTDDYFNTWLASLKTALESDLASQ